MYTRGTNLQHAHLVSVAQNFMSLFVEAVPDVSHRHKHLKGVIFINLCLSRPDFSLELLHSLSSVGREG